jgi:hypothetical protein
MMSVEEQHGEFIRPPTLSDSHRGSTDETNVSSTGGKSSSEKKSARLGFFLGYA